MRRLLSQVWVVLRCELRMHVRDRRALTSALSMPLLGPVLFGAMLLGLAAMINKDKPLELPVVGAQHAPGLMAFLERNGAAILPAPADPETTVLEGKADVVLIIPERYAEDFRRGIPAKLEVLKDASRNSARTSHDKLETLLRTYAGSVGTQRLLLRGVSPQLAQPIAIEEVDLATPEKLAGTLLHTMVMFLIIAAFAAGMPVAIDTTAGERERGSLEALLLNPVDRRALVLGKWLGVLSVVLVSELLLLVGYAAVVRLVPLEDLGVKVALGPVQLLQLFAVVLPLCLLATAVEMFVASFARSFKEAQTYLTTLMFVPMLPTMVLSFHPLEPQPWMWAVPSLGQDLLASAIIRGEGLPALGLPLGLLVCSILAAVALAGCHRLFSDARIVFGGAR